ncbi:MAG: PepSY domain-containing protein [Rhizomicrobium sp.]
MRLSTIFLCALVSLPVATLAQGHGPAPASAPRLDKILQGFRQAHPGTFYDAEGPYRGQDGRMHYRLKWMTPQGHMVWYDTDARSGAVLGRVRGPRTMPPGDHPGHDLRPQDRHHR